MSTPAQSFDRWHLYADTKRIINTNIGHFLILTLFFLPFAFSLLAFTSTTLQSTHFQFDLLTTINIPSYKSLLLPLLSTLSLFLLALSGISTITQVTYHAYCGTQLNLLTSIKSLSHSLIRLASTALAAGLSIIVICLIFAISAEIATKIVKILWFQIDYTSNYSITQAAIVATIFASVLILCLTNWGLAGVVVVTESKWGFEPFVRSAYLLKGVKSESLFTMLLSMISIGVMMWSNSVIVLSFGVNWWTNWALVFQAVAASGYIALIMLQYSVSSTVLYMYCKALHGELVTENASEEFSGEYVSLKVTDEISLPVQVFKDEPNGIFEYLFLFLTVYWSLLGLFIYFC